MGTLALRKGAQTAHNIEFPRTALRAWPAV
jgi:hypothetical protein